MKKLLNRLIGHQQLSKEEARQVLIDISEDRYSSHEIAAFLTVFMMRSITLDELEGFRDALLELCVKIDLSDYNTVDLCGTGGDGMNTFNISTVASFITAGAGVLVTKHGNYGVSSLSGSSNVMEELGIKFSNDPGFLKTCLDKAGICILHAPLFHPAMKNVAPIRKALGVKTFFNMLGPMVNPAFPKNQLVGVFDLELARMYGYLYQKSKKNYAILHAMDGYDEITLTGPVKVIRNASESILLPSHLGLKPVGPLEIEGGKTVTESAEIFMNILRGEGSEARNNVVCSNAAMAISVVKNIPLTEAFTVAREALLNKNALAAFKKLQELSEKS
jgi:anthranilate phosphoribosyltransferase